ncbi:MAG: conjugal transfer protein TrbE, partial [Kiritimatiellae bacterium]|nr:conjugal transfer protein TrbE [Kiritimatiellia bacterium]
MITSISIAIATLGVAMLLLLYSRIRATHSLLELKRHRSKDAGFADLLNYAALVDDGIVVGKNGSFMAAWLYKGDDNASSTDTQREMVSFRINQALSGLGNGWMIHVDAVRRD